MFINKLILTKRKIINFIFVKNDFFKNKLNAIIFIIALLFLYWNIKLHHLLTLEPEPLDFELLLDPVLSSVFESLLLLLSESDDESTESELESFFFLLFYNFNIFYIFALSIFCCSVILLFLLSSFFSSYFNVSNFLIRNLVKI